MLIRLGFMLIRPPWTCLDPFPRACALFLATYKHTISREKQENESRLLLESLSPLPKFRITIAAKMIVTSRRKIAIAAVGYIQCGLSG